MLLALTKRVAVSITLNKPLVGECRAYACLFRNAIARELEVRFFSLLFSLSLLEKAGQLFKKDDHHDDLKGLEENEPLR